MRIEIPDALCVQPTPQSQCAAALMLIRPTEAPDPVLVDPWGHRVMARTADDVATWWQFQIAGRRLRYMPDPPECDRWTSPAETLRRGGDDCDGLAVLAVSILRRIGVTAYFVVGEATLAGGTGGHAWCEGVDVAGPYLFEATNGTLYRFTSSADRPANYAPRQWTTARSLLRNGSVK
jgi:transglutaminase-like putative cysteine protease